MCVLVQLMSEDSTHQDMNMMKEEPLRMNEKGNVRSERTDITVLV